MNPADADDVASAADGDVAGSVTLSDGSELPVTLDAGLVDQARSEGVSIDRLRAAAVPDTAMVDLTAQTDADSSATIPVQDHRQTDLTNRMQTDRDFQFIQDDQIRRLIRNSVNYTERVGRFLLARDDLIPTIKERLKSLIVGQEGLTVEPADPDNDADARLADLLEDRYSDDIKPGDVIDTILRENMMNARAVLRSTDLKELDLSTLDYLRDGVTGEEIYVQDQTTVYQFEVDDPDDPGDGMDTLPGIDLDTTTVEPQPLVIGDHVFDISLYDTPPLEAVADTAINKMVLQRLKARKAEITSFGAVYAKVEPPSYLPEDQYFDRVADDDWDGDGQPPTKLERAMRSNIQSAFDTLKDFQSGTVMSVPDFWSLEQLEIPDSGDPIDDQIRGYNRDISRRLLVPLDLIELQSGSELSRETMFQTLMTTVAGWRREIKRIFDDFADTVADIEGISGDVDHQFPPLRDADTQQIISSLQYAGVAGLTEKEVRQMMNAVQGIDLETDVDGRSGQAPSPSPPDGGPSDPDDRTQQMDQFLNEQRRGADDAEQGQDDGQDDTAQASKEDIPSVPDAPTERASDLWKELINRAVTGVGPMSMTASWNPALHPRGPDGKFVKRPYDVPDEIRSLSAENILRELASTDPDFESKLDDVQIDVDDDALDKAVSEGRDASSQDTPDGFKDGIPDIPDGSMSHDTVDPDVVDPDYHEAAVARLSEMVRNGDVDLGTRASRSGRGALGLDSGLESIIADAANSDIPTKHGNLASSGSLQAIQPYLMFDGLSDDQASAAVEAINARLPDGYYATSNPSESNPGAMSIRVKRSGKSLTESSGEFKRAFREDTGNSPNAPSVTRGEVKQWADGMDLQERFDFPSNRERAALDRAMMAGLRDTVISDPVERRQLDRPDELSARIKTTSDFVDFDDDEYADDVAAQLGDWMSGFDDETQDAVVDAMAEVKNTNPSAKSLGGRSFRLGAGGSKPVNAHELGHGIAFAHGLNQGLRPDRDSQQFGGTYHDWDDNVVAERSALRSTVSDGIFEDGEVPGLDDYTDRVEAETARVEADDFDAIGDREADVAQHLREDIETGDMIRASEPLPDDERFGNFDPDPMNYQVVDTERPYGDDPRTERIITVEDYAGDQYEIRARPSTFEAENEQTFLPDIEGVRSGTPDGWGLDKADPDDHLGTSDRAGDDAWREHYEAVNEAWYRQAVVNRDGGEKAAKATALGQGDYSVGNAGETIGRLHESLTGESNHSAATAHALVNYHPRLLESLRHVRDIPPQFRSLLNDELERAGADYRFEQ